MNWELFPLVVQAVYVASAAPPLLRLVKSKRSDQHAIVNQFLALGAHFAMAGWAWKYAGEMGIVAASLISVVTTLLTAGTILYYRAHPGGRPERPRSERRPAWTPGSSSAGATFRPVIG